MYYSAYKVGGGAAAGGDGDGETDMSAALQMGLGAAVAGELSGACVSACVCVCVCCYREPLLPPCFPLPSFAPSLSLPLSSSIQVGFPTSLKNIPSYKQMCKRFGLV